MDYSQRARPWSSAWDLTSPTFAGEKPNQPKAAADPVWWYEGFAEIGGRFDLNSPKKTTLGKFYEYVICSPAYSAIYFIGAHRSGGLFDIDVWGKNVGWDDQAFGLDLAKPGAYYLTFGWDQTPHSFRKNAMTTMGRSAAVCCRRAYYGGPSADGGSDKPS